MSCPALARPSKKYTADEKTEAMIEWLTERHDDFYPHDYDILQDESGEVWLVVAELDPGKEDNATLIRKYPLKSLPRWYDRALNVLKACDDNFEAALWEVE